MSRKKRYISGVAVCLMLLFCACGRNSPTWQEQYELGLHYLAEESYEEAILAFLAAIEIDPQISDTYLRAADAYLALEDEEHAASVLHQGYQETNDDELLARIQEVEAQQKLNAYGAIEFSQRAAYIDYNSLREEQQEVLQVLITAVVNKDRAAITDRIDAYQRVFDSNFYTETEEYRVRMQSYTGNDVRIEIRPQNGMGYYAMACPFAGIDTSDATENDYYTIWGYASCECVDWQPDGPFTREGEQENITGDVTFCTQTGEAQDGVIVGTVNCTANDYIYAENYQDGYLVVADGLSDTKWGPLECPNRSRADAEGIWW